MSTLLFFSPGIQELVIILFVVLLLFGGRKIPELMRGLGKGIREFNTARASIEGEIREGASAAAQVARGELTPEQALATFALGTVAGVGGEASRDA